MPTIDRTFRKLPDDPPTRMFSRPSPKKNKVFCLRRELNRRDCPGEEFLVTITNLNVLSSIAGPYAYALRPTLNLIRRARGKYSMVLFGPTCSTRFQSYVTEKRLCYREDTRWQDYLNS